MKRCRIDLCGDAAGFDIRLLQAAVDAALAADGLLGCAMTVLGIDDAEAARLHQEHFGDPSTTDVMSFPDGSSDPADGLRHLGDLAVCIDVARREAASRGRPLAHELALYVVHGLLHLLGHDDQDADERAAMWAEQRRVLALAGVAIEAEPD